MLLLNIIKRRRNQVIIDFEYMQKFEITNLAQLNMGKMSRLGGIIFMYIFVMSKHCIFRKTMVFRQIRWHLAVFGQYVEGYESLDRCRGLKVLP